MRSHAIRTLSALISPLTFVCTTPCMQQHLIQKVLLISWGHWMCLSQDLHLQGNYLGDTGVAALAGPLGRMASLKRVFLQVRLREAKTWD